MDRKPAITDGRILGLDYGSKRIGVSVSDPLKILARAYGAVDNAATKWKKLADIVASEEVELIVVGMPLTLKGEMGRKAEEVAEFIEELQARVTVPVVSWDERFTTSIAQRTQRSMGTKRSNRQARDGSLDAMAASVMLQGFLDSRKNSVCS